MIRPYIFLLVVIASLTSLVRTIGAIGVLSQARVEIVGPLGEIPRDSYRTWSLFLVCSPDWASADRSRDLENLYWRFRSFGDAIGRDNLAVWFWTQKTSTQDPRLAEKVDVARSTEYCRTLKLKPSEGPFLVVTSAYPDLAAFPRDRAVFQLGGLEPAALAKLLNSLTDQLLLEGKVEAARHAIAKEPSPASPSAGPQPADLSFWIRFLEAGRRTIVDLGCALKIQVDAGPLSAELRGCAE